MQVWSKSTHSFRRQGADKPFSINLCLSVTLKMGSRPSKSKQFFSMSQQLRCTSLVKIHPFIQETGCRQAMFQQFKPYCYLENGSKSPNSKQFFSMSQQYSCTSLVKIHLFIQEILCIKTIFQQSKPSCDLENGVKVTKI